MTKRDFSNLNNTIYSQISSNGQNPQGMMMGVTLNGQTKNLQGYSCTGPQSMPTIGISMNGVLFNMNPATYIYPLNVTIGTTTELYCFLLFRSTLPPSNNPPIVLGIPFF